MSKRTKTPVYSFRTFENAGMNQAATDFSANWHDLDGILKTRFDALDAEDVRLDGKIDAETAARETEDAAINQRIDDLTAVVDDLNPESIEDFKTRLNAVEHKVATNSGLINLIQKKDEEQDELLENHEQRLTALEAGVTALEEKHDADMALVNEHLTALDEEQGLQNERIQTLEDECEVCKHELADLQSHVEAINDELVTVTNQVETLTGIVNDVKMDVDSKQPIALMQPIDMDGRTYYTVEELLRALAARQPAPPAGQYTMYGEDLHVNRSGYEFIPPEELNIYGSGDFGVDGEDLQLAEEG